MIGLGARPTEAAANPGDAVCQMYGSSGFVAGARQIAGKVERHPGSSYAFGRSKSHCGRGF
jgi:hypothetical protein